MAFPGNILIRCSSFSSPTPPTTGYFLAVRTLASQHERAGSVLQANTRPRCLFIPSPHLDQEVPRGLGPAPAAPSRRTCSNSSVPPEDRMTLLSLPQLTRSQYSIKLVLFVHKPSRFFPSRLWPCPRAHRDNRRVRRSRDASLPVSTAELTKM